jgi:hypothetical protein
MLLIKHALGDYDIHDDCVEHLVKKMCMSRRRRLLLPLHILAPSWLM